MKPCLIEGMPFKDYLSNDAYGSSDLKTFRAGPPAMVPWSRANRSDDTAATRIGSAAHCKILTPSLFADTYAIKPDGMSFATKEGKAWRADHEQFEILTYAEGVAVDGAVKAFQSKRAARVSLETARHIEASVLWSCPYSGLPLKSRPDWVDDHAVYDLKVTVSAERSLRRMVLSAYLSGWFHQLASNREAFRQLRGDNSPKVGRLVMIAPNPPQEQRSWTIEIREETLDFVELENQATRAKMMECVKSGVWPGTPDSWLSVEMPAIADFPLESEMEGVQEVVDE